MIITKLFIKNFRSFDELELSFENKRNIIIGSNGIGKTSIIEAIYAIVTTKSFLNVSETYLINKNSNYFYLKGLFNRNNQNINLEYMLDKEGKKLKANNTEKKKISEYIFLNKILYFCPDDIRIIKDSPSIRRKYFDVELCQLTNGYVKLLKDFQQTLKQRNDYLKYVSINSVDNIYLNIINSQFTKLNENVFHFRKEYINKLNKYIGDVFFSLSGIKELKIEYISDFIDKNSYKQKIDKNLANDIKNKYTQYGVHHDNYIFSLNNENMLFSSSQGQMRLAVLSLKLSEVKVMINDYNILPIVLLDDIFSELDIEKRNEIMKYLNNDLQIIITTTDIDLIDEKNLIGANIINLNEIRERKNNND